MLQHFLGESSRMHFARVALLLMLGNLIINIVKLGLIDVNTAHIDSNWIVRLHRSRIGAVKTHGRKLHLPSHHVRHLPTSICTD